MMVAKFTKEKDLVDSILAIGCDDLLNGPEVSRCFNKINMYSDELYRHSLNVAILSVIIGACVYMDKEKIKGLFVSGLLHDYGKLYISKEILYKSKELTYLERMEIEKHSVKGYQYLKDERCFSNDILLGILQHHERMDGKGYGEGLCEDKISESAKIIMIADVYDAMISDRVYRSKLERGIVYEYLFSNAGKHFSIPLIKYFVNTTLTLNLENVVIEVKKQILDKCGYEKQMAVSK